MTKSKQEELEKLRKFWKSHLNKWVESGLTQADYCRQHNLMRHRFAYWKKRHAPNHLPVKFVQVEPGLMHGSAPAIKMNVGQRLQIEIPDGFARETLADAGSDYSKKHCNPRTSGPDTDGKVCRCPSVLSPGETVCENRY